MKILFVTEYFPPEPNAAATRVHENVWRWSKAGHDVTVITTAPNFPQGKVHRGYRNRWYQEEMIDGVRVVRVKSFIYPNRDTFGRILDQVSFLPTALAALLREARPDVVVAMSPTLFAVLAAWFGAWLRRIPYVLEVGDLVAGSIDAVGVMRKGMLLRLVEWLEGFVFRRADRVIVQTARMKGAVQTAGVTEGRIHVISNGVNLERFGPGNEVKSPRREFVAGYIGTLGMAHGLRHMLEAAKLLEDEPGIRFLFVGDGADRPALERMAGQRHQHNVKFDGPFPHESVPSIWRSLDLALVSLRNHETFETVVPSKIFEAMACGVPILLSAPAGEASDLVQKHGVGTVIPPENPRLIADMVKELSTSPEVLRRQSEAGVKNAGLYDRGRRAVQYLEILRQTVADRAKR